MFDVHFYLRDKRSTKARQENKKLPFQIEMHVFCGLSKPVIFYTGERILREEWEKTKQKAKGKFNDQINRSLIKYRRLAEEIYFDLKSTGRLTIENFKERLKGGGGEKGFFEYFEKFIQESKGRISSVTGQKLSLRTMKYYKTTINTFRESKLDFTFEGMDMRFYSKLRSYIVDKKNLHPNTFGNYIKCLKTFLSWAVYQGLPVNPHYKLFEKPNNYEAAEPLTFEELDALWEIDFSLNPELRKCFDIFMFLVSTGLRISDYNKLSKDNFKKDHIELSQQKTSGKAIIPFFDDKYFRPKYLYCRYNGNLPKISGQKLNGYLERIQKMAGITRIRVTSKTGRKTFATLKVLLGVNPFTIMKSTGHKDYKSFRQYVGISIEDVIKENREKAKYLKVS